MATTNLGLPIVTGNMTADVVRDVNALANGVDGKAGVASGLATLGTDGKLTPAQAPTISDASTTVKGIVTLEDSTASTSITKAATPNSVKTVNDALATHQADYVTHYGFGATTNTANAYAITLSPAPTSYADGMGVKIKVNADSTGASTLNVNSLGAKALKNTSGNDVTNLKTNGMYTFIYNATTGNFILQGEGVDATPLITAQNAIFGM